jgi:hypothetical protein
LGYDIPKQAERKKKRADDLHWIDKESLEVAKNAENQPCVRISWTCKDHPEADEEAEKRENG